jgi:hypothetical protein
MRRKHLTKPSTKRKLRRKKKPKVRPSTRLARKRQSYRRKKPLVSRKRKIPGDPRIARALGKMRREGISASQAARQERMKLGTLRKGAGRFLYRSGPGKPWKARSEDQLAFSMEVLTAQGRVTVIVRNSRERRLLHRYENALRMFRGAEDGAEAELQKFQGKSVGGHVLLTNVKQIIELEQADLVDVENLYSPSRGRL